MRFQVTITEVCKEDRTIGNSFTNLQDAISLAEDLDKLLASFPYTSSMKVEIKRKFKRDISQRPKPDIDSGV